MKRKALLIVAILAIDAGIDLTELSKLGTVELSGILHVLESIKNQK